MEGLGESPRAHAAKVVGVMIGLASPGSLVQGIWLGRAQSLVELVGEVLENACVARGAPFDAKSFVSMMELEALVAESRRGDLPDDLARRLDSYLTNFPGFEKGKAMQSESTRDIFGYVKMAAKQALSQAQRIMQERYEIEQAALSPVSVRPAAARL